MTPFVLALTSSCSNQVRLRSTFVNKSHPDRIQAKDSELSGRTAPHPIQPTCSPQINLSTAWTLSVTLMHATLFAVARLSHLPSDFETYQV